MFILNDKYISINIFKALLVSEIFHKFITVDETWVYLFPFERKVRSSYWSIKMTTNFKSHHYLPKLKAHFGRRFGENPGILFRSDQIMLKKKSILYIIEKIFMLEFKLFRQ